MRHRTSIDSPEASTLDPRALKREDIYRIYIKLGVMVLFAAICIFLVHFSGLKTYLADAQKIKQALAESGTWAPVLFTAAATLSILFGLPRLLFCALGGLLFGFIEGFILAQAASLIGAYGSFLFARWGAREWVCELVNSKKSLQAILNKPSFTAVFFSRQLPVGGIFISMLLGLSNVRHRDFLAGSLLGFLPEAVVATLVGSGAAKTSTLLATLQIVSAAVVVLLAVTIILRLVSNDKAVPLMAPEKCP